MSGGVGSRFGANMPKQYVKLSGKPVIEYVLEAALSAEKVDKVVVVMDKQFAVKLVMISGKIVKNKLSEEK